MVLPRFVLLARYLETLLNVEQKSQRVWGVAPSFTTSNRTLKGIQLGAGSDTLVRFPPVCSPTELVYWDSFLIFAMGDHRGLQWRGRSAQNLISGLKVPTPGPGLVLTAPLGLSSPKKRRTSGWGVHEACFDKYFSGNPSVMGVLFDCFAERKVGRFLVDLVVV